MAQCAGPVRGTARRQPDTLSYSTTRAAPTPLATRHGVGIPASGPGTPPARAAGRPYQPIPTPTPAACSLPLNAAPIDKETFGRRRRW